MCSLTSRSPSVNPKPRPRQSRKPSPRPLLSWRLHFPPLHSLPGQLSIWQGKTGTDYEIRNLASDFGVAYTLTKLSIAGPTTTYHTCLDAEGGLEGNHLCDCLGHEAHGTPCKHIRTLLRLLERGELRTVHTDPEPVAGAVVDDCPF